MGEATIIYNFKASPIPSYTSMIFCRNFFATLVNKKLGFFKSVNLINFSFWKSSPLIYIKHFRFEKKLLIYNIYATNDNNIVFRVFNMFSSLIFSQFYDIDNLAQKFGWSCTNL
jgi:hypothetical protein